MIASLKPKIESTAAQKHSRTHSRTYSRTYSRTRMVRGQSERKPQQPEEIPDIVAIIYSLGTGFN